MQQTSMAEVAFRGAGWPEGQHGSGSEQIFLYGCPILMGFDRLQESERVWVFFIKKQAMLLTMQVFKCLAFNISFIKTFKKIFK